MKLQNTNLCELRCKNYLVILLLCMNLLWFQPTTVASALGNETDHLALLKIKESITNDPHEVMSSWNDSIHFCNWHGVTCSLRHQRVTTLNLNGNNLGGSISPYIGNLTFLRFMYLQNNSFTGKIPQEVVHLFRLQHLNLTRNKLGGEIPVNLSSCSELRIVDFTVNSLIGRIPSELGSLAKLMVLNLGVNNLTGGIPPSLGNLSSLTGLSVAYNNIAGTIPDEIGRLNTLSIFTTSSNKLTGTVPPSLYNMSSLTIISISQNQLNGTLPANIGLTLSNLKIFGIGINEFSGPIPTSLSNASQLQIFDISNNNFERQVPTNLGNLQDLWWLGLGRNNLGSNSSNDLDFLTSLTNCSNLQILDFSMNHFGGIISNSIGNLSTQVSELYMGGNQISGTIPTALENLVNLIVLGMEGNLFSGNVPNSLGKLQNLQGLGLRVNSLSGEIPSSIGNLTQLSEMYLSQNKLEGAIPASIVNCQKLQLLEISENKFTGPIPPQVIGLSSLTKLANFSQNSLTGSLPVEVGKLIHIIALDVSNNNLSGEIPNTIGDCQSLEYLILQDNSFQGRIPLTLTSLKGLQYVDLSQNNLTGKIPEDLQNLQFLVHLNLSFNDLEGEVPSKGVFHNASAISVIGNSKLCGGVPELQLPACPVQVTKRGKSLAFKLTVSMVCVVLFLFFLSAFLVFYKKRSSKGKQFSTFPSTDILPNVSYKSLYQATGCFSSSNLIGSGSFGSVYKGTLQEQERVVAVKVLKLQKKGASKSFINECNALRNIRHRNLVKILTCCSSVDYSGQDFKALVFEFLTNGSLDGWLHPKNDSEIQSRNLSLLQRLNVAIDVAYALHYLHDLCEQPIIHCDLKPSNVLLDNDMIAHVSDFGLARILAITNEVSQNQTSTTGVKGSIGYTAPEYGMGGEASTQGDVYSYGILVLEMFIGRRPTDEIFKDGFSLYNFVEKALPERLTQIVDPALLTREAETVAPMEEDNYQNDIEVAHETSYNENWIQMKENVHKCLLSVLKIGLACSMESPKDRTNIKDVTLKLQLIKDDFLGEGIRGASPNTMQFTGMQPSGN